MTFRDYLHAGWFSREWWAYLLAPRSSWRRPWPAVIWCRMRGHPEGPIWYTSYKLEPDMRCQNCGDDCG